MTSQAAWPREVLTMMLAVGKPEMKPTKPPSQPRGLTMEARRARSLHPSSCHTETSLVSIMEMHHLETSAGGRRKQSRQIFLFKPRLEKPLT